MTGRRRLNHGALRTTMHSLLETEPFESLAPVLRAAAGALGTDSPVTLLAEPTTVGALALAHLEAAMLDAGIAYRRRVPPRDGQESAAIIISEGSPTEEPKPLGSGPFRLHLSPLSVHALHGHDGSPHSGTLSPVAQAAALAAELAPDGRRVRMLRPWLLAGNWLSDALDTSYDPVYSRLRDHLRDEGAFRVVPIPSVSEPDATLLPAIDAERLSATKDSWSGLDEHQQAEALSEIAAPEVFSGTLGTARLEELVWHRLVVSNRPRDLHSQFAALQTRFSDDGLEAVSTSIDQLLSTGEVE